MNSVFINGNFFKREEARISAFDIGLTRSLAVYEGITAIGERPFRLDDHLSRLRKSAVVLGMKVIYSDEEIKEALKVLLQNTNFKRSAIRIYVTGGEMLNNTDFDPNKSTFIMSVEELLPFEPKLYTTGAKLLTYEHLRFMPEIKTTNYITAVLGQKTRKSEGAIETLYTYKNLALECSTSNFFIVKNEILITPKENILKGITRKVVIEIAKGEKISVEERRVQIDEVYDADEVFITSSFKDVMPIIVVNDQIVNNKKIGYITRKVGKIFKDLINN
jgi:branched-chain amino acid aminotransferase